MNRDGETLFILQRDGESLFILLYLQVSERLVAEYGWRGALQILAVTTGIVNLCSALTFFHPETRTSHSSSQQQGGKWLLADDAVAKQHMGEDSYKEKNVSFEMTEIDLHEDTPSAVQPGAESKEGVTQEKYGRGKKDQVLSMYGIMVHPSFWPCAMLAVIFAGCMWVPYIYLPAFQYDTLDIPLKEGAQVRSSSFQWAYSHGIDLWQVWSITLHCGHSQERNVQWRLSVEMRQ